MLKQIYFATTPLYKNINICLNEESEEKTMIIHFYVYFEVPVTSVRLAET